MRRAKPRFSRLCLVVVVTLLMTGLAQSASQLVTFQFVNTEYKDVFQTLGEIAGLNVLVDKSVTGTGSFAQTSIFRKRCSWWSASGADHLIRQHASGRAAERGRVSGASSTMSTQTHRRKTDSRSCHVHAGR